jgi:hypothetical protein
MDINPYAPPAEASLPPSLPTSDVFFFRDGDFLVVRDGAVLPPVCLRTNEPAGEDSWRKKVTLTWSPPWVFLLILINILVMLVVMLAIQKKARITYSLCTAARAAIVRNRSIGFFLFLMALVLFYEAFTWTNELAAAAGLIGVISLIVSLVYFVIADPVKVVKVNNGWFRIKGCSKGFLATLPELLSPF